MATSEEELDKRVEDAANLIIGGWNGAATEMIRGALYEVQSHHHGAGGRSYDHWIASLEMLATVCMAIAKMARNKTKNL
jgi:hypothetical protein